MRELCIYLSLADGAAVRVLEHPDRDRPGVDGCDAIILRGTRRVAVEHTRAYMYPGKPGVVKRLDRIRPIISERVTRRHPTSLVQVGVPIEEFAPGVDWDAMAAEVGERCAEVLDQAGEAEGRLPVRVPCLRERAFVQRLFRVRAPRGFCSVSPAIWGREPEVDTVLDFRRAIAEKRETLMPYHDEGMPTVLLLDVEDYLAFDAAVELYAQALAQEPSDGIDEAYLAASGYQPSFLVPLGPDPRSTAAWAERTRFVALRPQVERVLKRVKD